MKNRCLCLLAVSVALLFTISCTKKPGSPEVQAAIDLSGIVASQGAPFYRDTGTAEAPRIEFQAVLDFGLAAKRRAGVSSRTVVVGGQTLEVIPVELASSESLPEGTVPGPVEGWMQPAHFAGGGAEPAVVKADQAALLNGPDSSAKVLAKLPRMSLLAVTRGAGTGDFVPALVVDPMTRKQYPQAYVDMRQLSVSHDDVRAAVLVARAEAARSPEETNALLEDAERSFPSSAFIGDIRVLLGGAAPAQGPSTEPLAAGLAARVEGAQVRAAPSADAEVVATVSLDEVVQTTSRTVDTFEVNGQTAHWYEVDSPAHGWVFGADLEGAD